MCGVSVFLRPMPQHDNLHRTCASHTLRAAQGIRLFLDLDLDNGVIHVRQSVWRGQIQTVKSRKGNRRFPISAELMEHLRAYLQTWRPNNLGLLFATGNGTPWNHSLVRKRKFHPLLKKLGIPQCGFHAFRHGIATLLDQIGAPMAVRLNRLGHAEAQTTMGYTHAVMADERRIADDLGRILHGTARNEEEERPAENSLTLYDSKIRRPY
jgi:integrase